MRTSSLYKGCNTLKVKTEFRKEQNGSNKCNRVKLRNKVKEKDLEN